MLEFFLNNLKGGSIKSKKHKIYKMNNFQKYYYLSLLVLFKRVLVIFKFFLNSRRKLHEQVSEKCNSNINLPTLKNNKKYSFA